MQLGERRLLPELDGWELQCRYPRRRPSRPQRGLKRRHQAQGRRRVGSAWPGRPRARSDDYGLAVGLGARPPPGWTGRGRGATRSQGAG